MKNPSTHWLSNLILVIQECNAETGLTFGAFLEQSLSGLDRESTDNYTIVQTLKKKFDMESRRKEALSDMHPVVLSDCHQAPVQYMRDKSSEYIIVKHICTSCNQECNKGRVLQNS